MFSKTKKVFFFFLLIFITIKSWTQEDVFTIIDLNQYHHFLAIFLVLIKEILQIIDKVNKGMVLSKTCPEK